MARKVELKEVEIKKGDIKETFSYRKNIERILDFTPQGGFSLGDVRLCNKIQAQLDGVEGDGSLVLEENLWNFLKKKVDAFRWGAYHPEIENFCDMILRAESFNIKGD
jgi:hypothetical protein